MQEKDRDKEEGLIRRLSQGDEKAFSEIYTLYWEKLLAVAFFHLHNKQAAEDVVHDVMLSLWKRRWKLQIKSLDAYLATAVKFAVFKSIMRDKKRREVVAVHPVSRISQDIEEQLEAKFLNEYLEEVKERLPEKTRIVFNYSREEGLSIADIASKIDLSPKAVEYHITKALRTFKNKLQKIKTFFI